MDTYTLKERKDTDEYHLFICTNRNKKCYPAPQSVCQEMHNSESIRNIFVCKDEDEARIKCAEIGRQVCGTCVSHLYETYNK